MLCLKYKQCWEASSFFSTAPAPSKKSLPALAPYTFFFYRLLWLSIHSFLPALAPYTFFSTYRLWLRLKRPSSRELFLGGFYQLQTPPYWFTISLLIFYRLQLPLKRPGSRDLFLGGFSGSALLYIGLWLSTGSGSL